MTLLSVIQESPTETPFEQRFAAPMARGARCDLCPLARDGQGPVMGELRRGSKLTVIEEAPGDDDLVQLRPLAGWSGRQVDMAISATGLTRGDVSYTHSILCMAPGSNIASYNARLTVDHKLRVRDALRAHLAAGFAKETFQEPPAPISPQDACFGRLRSEVAEADSKVILTLGKHGLESAATLEGVTVGQRAADETKPYFAHLKAQHGAPVHLADGRVVVASYRPGMAQRSKSEYRNVIRENITRAASIAARDGRTSWTEPQFHLFPTVDEIEAFCSWLTKHQLRTTVDVEAGPSAPGKKDANVSQVAKLRCIGLGAYDGEGEEHILVVPWGHMDATPWWTPAQEDRVRLAVRQVLDSCPLIGQNFGYDVGVLTRPEYHLMTKPDVGHLRGWTDTLLLHHDTPDNDLPHDLGFIGRRFFETPVWKGVDHLSRDNHYDWALHNYNAKDILVTMRSEKPLVEWVSAANTVEQYATDYKLAPILKEMNEIGVFVDEHKRGEFSKLFNAECQRYAATFREVVGRSVNPNSVPQLQDLFYGDPRFGGWGLQPVISTDGHEWEDGEDGSTSSSALIELRKKGVTDQQFAAVDHLLDFRAFAKLKGTYTDNLPCRPVDFWPDLGVAEAVQGWRWDKDLDQDVWDTVLPQRWARSRVHTIFKGHVVPTGRLSSSGPNLQNIPAFGKANIREMFVSPPGHVFVGADWAQLEARIYAVVAQDQLLLDTIARGYDIHSMNAATLMAAHPSEVMSWYERIEHGDKKDRKKLRTVAKRFCFLVIYGGEKDKLYSVMAAERKKGTTDLLFPWVTNEDCQRWYDNWHANHPETAQFHAMCHAEYAAYGCVRVTGLDNRARFFPGGASQKNAIPNMKIQGYAASLANDALIQLADAIPFYKWSPYTGLCLQVHDDIKVYVPEDKAEYTKGVMREIMTRTLGGVALPIGEATEGHVAEASFCWADQ